MLHDISSSLLPPPLYTFHVLFVFLCSLEMHKQLNPELAAAAVAVSVANSSMGGIPVSMAQLQPLGMPLKFPHMMSSHGAAGQPLFDTMSSQPKSLTTKLKGGATSAMFVQTHSPQSASAKKQNNGAGGGAGGGKFAPY